MGAGSVGVACAVDDPELRARVEDVLRALGVACTDPPCAPSDPFWAVAIVVMELLKTPTASHRAIHAVVDVDAAVGPWA